MESRLIILADNDPFAADFFRTAVQNLMSDIELISLSSHKELTNYFDTPFFRKPLLIFIGVNLPVQSSMECIRDLRMRFHENELCIVAYSCLLSAEMINTARKLGADYCISKPTSNVILQNLLIQMVSYAEELTESYAQS